MIIKQLSLVALCFLNIHSACPPEKEIAEPGQRGFYGDGTCETDKNLIENYYTSLAAMAKENDPEKNNTYQKLIKSIQSYAGRYLSGEDTTKQLKARQAFLAIFAVPLVLKKQIWGFTKNKPLFDQRFISYKSENWKVVD